MKIVYNKATRAAACKCFASGLTLLEISVKYHIAFCTLKQWHYRYGWKSKRKRWRKLDREHLLKQCLKEILKGLG
jgi:uncharacterized protein YjcR